HFTGEPPVMVPLDPMHANIESYTMMVNAYFDLGTWGRITPYVGAGIGMAYNRVDKVYFTNNPALTGIISGDSDLSFAWSLMAGLSFRLTERAILDVGYRYMDLGRAASGRADVTGTFVNPRAYFDDLGSHEVKVGLRYHFGGGNACCSAPTYVSVK
ncbi:MAG: outer membrane protein, partial [Hyphomicrobiaceae bacterium]